VHHQVWDFEFGRLESSCVGHKHGITSLLFLDPYPLLAAADSGGNIAIWAVRSPCEECPAKDKYKCVFHFSNNSTKPQHGIDYDTSLCPILVITTHITWSREDDTRSYADCGTKKEEGKYSTCEQSQKVKLASYTLYAGDEKGYITAWDLLPLLKNLSQNHGFQPVLSVFRCTNPRRKLRYNAKDMLDKLMSMPEKLAPLEHIHPSNVSFHSRRWQAHTDAISSLQLIKEPPSLLTSSFDCLVKVWSLSGKCLGVLRQGEGSYLRRHWNFTVDVDARQRKRSEEASQVICQINRTFLNQTEDHQQDIDAEYARIMNDYTQNSFEQSAMYHDISHELQGIATKLDVGLIPNEIRKAERVNPRRTPRMRPIGQRLAGKGFSASRAGLSKLRQPLSTKGNGILHRYSRK